MWALQSAFDGAERQGVSQQLKTEQQQLELEQQRPPSQEQRQRQRQKPSGGSVMLQLAVSSGKPPEWLVLMGWAELARIWLNGGGEGAAAYVGMVSRRR